MIALFASLTPRATDRATEFKFSHRFNGLLPKGNGEASPWTDLVPLPFDAGVVSFDALGFTPQPPSTHPLNGHNDASLRAFFREGLQP